MKTTNPVDAARVELLLADLRLPAFKLMWAKLAQQSDKEGWRFLHRLIHDSRLPAWEHEIWPSRRVAPMPWISSAYRVIDGQSHPYNIA